MEKVLIHTTSPDTKNQEKYSDLYYNELRNNILPFWYSKSADREHGGYFTCLTREGNVYDTDKFIWLQGRQVWTFSTMYRALGQQEEWKDFAESQQFLEGFSSVFQFKRKLFLVGNDPFAKVHQSDIDVVFFYVHTEEKTSIGH